jgi:uncharacterized protein
MSEKLHRHATPKVFLTSGIITVLSLALVLYLMGVEAMFIAAMLMIIELTFSFDNAIINARTLSKMSPFWQRMFMTVGIFIAVFGMRVIFPIIIVMATAGLSWGDVINLALNEPDKYAEALHHAHPSIAAFGGMFLFTLALHFFFDSSREIRWLHAIERPMQEINRRGLYIFVSAALLGIITLLPGNAHPKETLTAGLLGIAIYVVIHGLSEAFSRHHEKAQQRAGGKMLQAGAMAGFASFLYLEVLDASFSFDGVIGAFAVTKDVVLIAVGLGVGALWVRSMTLYIVHRKVLNTYRYLEHAAHYVIGALAGTLLLGIFFEIPEMYVGLLGLVVIAIAISNSVRDNKLDAAKS